MPRIEIRKLSLLDGKQRHAPPEIGQVSAGNGTLYVLVEVSAPTEMWDDASRQIVQAALETFRESRMGDTGALQAAAEAVNDWLLEQNRSLRRNDWIWAGFNAALVQGSHLYLAQAGPALTYISRDGAITRFPKSFSELKAKRDQGLSPLGDDVQVRSRLAHFELEPDDRIVMAASHLPTLGEEPQIADALNEPSADEVAQRLAALATGADFSALVLDYEPSVRARVVASVPTPEPAAKQDQEEDDEDTWLDEEWAEELAEDDWYQEEEPTPEPAKEAGWRTAAATRTAPDTPSQSDDRGGARRAPAPDPEPAPPRRAPAPDPEPTPPRRAPDPEPDRPTQPDDRGGARRAPAPDPEPTPPPRTTPTPRVTRTERVPSAASEAVTRPFDEDEEPRDPPRRRPVPTRFKPSTARREPDPPPRRERSRAERSPQPEPALESGAGTPFSYQLQLLLRRVGAALMSLLAALLAGTAALVRWMQHGLQPRIAAAAPALDRGAHGMWEGLGRAWDEGKQMSRQLLPGVRTTRRKKRRASKPPGDGSSFLKTLVVVVPLLVALVAAVLLWRTPATGVPEAPPSYAQLTGEARQLIGQARSVDEHAARGLLEQALQRLEIAATLEGEANPAEIEALRREARDLAALAQGGEVAQVRRLATSESGDPQVLAAGGGRGYAIDARLGAVYPVLPERGAPVALEPPTQPLIAAEQRGSGGIVVGRPQHMVWVQGEGGRGHEGLLILTGNGQLWDYDPATHQLTQLSIALVPTVDAVATYGGNLYVLDRANRQIWKYVPDAAGQYSEAPSPWLTQTGIGQIGDPIDMAIDGFIYLLDRLGEVNRFQVGERRAGFALDAPSPPLTEPVAMAKRPPESSDLFVADAARVVRFDAEGRFLAEYRAPLGTDWGTIRDIALDTTRPVLYILSDQGLFELEIGGGSQ